jgi:hypothetical protein
MFQYSILPIAQFPALNVDTMIQSQDGVKVSDLLNTGEEFLFQIMCHGVESVQYDFHQTYYHLSRSEMRRFLEDILLREIDRL